jgi:hypothetical protein
MEVASVWRSIRAQLADLATLNRVEPDVGDDIRALLRLLRQLPPGPGTAESDLERLEDSTRAGDALTAGLRTFPQIAAESRSALARLQVAGQLLVPAVALSRDEVSEDPALAAARLRRIWIPAQPGHIQGLLKAFDQAAIDLGPSTLANEHPEI